jgi:hypothetical protein
VTSWLIPNGLAQFAAAACRTVVWSRPPKLLPISGSDSWVSSLASAIAICRGLATARERFLLCMSVIRIL